MADPHLIKEEIRQVLATFLGSPTAKTFVEFYGDETLPIYADAALKLLEGFIGYDKAKKELEAVFIRNHTEHNYV